MRDRIPPSRIGNDNENYAADFRRAAGLVVYLNASVFAAEMATPDEAKAMGEKAMDTLNSMGKDEVSAQFAAADGGFQEKDLYVFCMDMEGTMLFHTKKPDLGGKNLLDFDKYGDRSFEDMIKVAKNDRQG